MATIHIRRRTTVLAAALITAGAVLTACGSSSDEASGDDSALSCAAPGQSGERTVTGTYLGDVEVPASPQRIVSGWLVGTQLIDLGVRPVGMLDDYKANATPDELAQVEGVATIGSITAGVNTEQVLTLDPDLVITFVREDTAEKLAVRDTSDLDIPTVAFEIQEPVDVWNNYTNVAEAIGCGDFARERIAGLDDQLRDIAVDNADAISAMGPVAYVEGTGDPGTYQISTNKSLVYERLSLAGLTYFDGVPANPARYVEQVSVEDIGRLSSANVLFFEADFEGNPTERTKALIDSPAFAALPAVVAGNLFPYRTPYAYTTAAVERQAEDITVAVNEATPAAE